MISSEQGIKCDHNSRGCAEIVNQLYRDKIQELQDEMEIIKGKQKEMEKKQNKLLETQNPYRLEPEGDFQQKLQRGDEMKVANGSEKKQTSSNSYKCETRNEVTGINGRLEDVLMDVEKIKVIKERFER